MKNFYANWEIEEWTTPFSQDRTLVLESFLLLSELHIILCSADKTSYWIKFRRGCPFRCIDESNRVGLWQTISLRFEQSIGRAFFVKKSDLLDFIDEYDLYYFENKGSKFSYFIGTDNECLEIIESPEHPPEIKVFKDMNPNEIMRRVVEEDCENFSDEKH